MITLKTLPVSTKQDVFDQVARHLIRQGRRSEKPKNISNSADFVCMYRLEDKACAAGCLIGDDEYNAEMEYQTWDELMATSKVPKDHANLIVPLQAIHDNCGPLDWEENLKVLAENSNLKWNL